MAVLGLSFALLAAGPAAAGNHGNGNNGPNTNIPSSIGGVSLEALLCVPQLLANGTGAALTKTVSGVENNGDGSYTIAFDYESNRPDGVYKLRDCAFRDTGDNGTYNALLDPVVGATNEENISLVGGEGSGEITVLAEEGDVICDRLILSGSGPPNFTHRSNIACVDLAENEVPIGAVGAVGLVALSAGFFAVAYTHNRRRIRATRVSPTTSV